MEIKIAKPDNIEILIPSLLVLRPNLNKNSIKEQFISQLKEGYMMIYIGDDNLAFAIAGFRTLNFIFSGKTLYIDNLITHPDHIRNGYAGNLLDWIKNMQKKMGMNIYL